MADPAKPSTSTSATVTRAEFNRMAAKVDNLTTRDWRTFFAGFSAVMLVILSVGGVISWGLLDKLERIEFRLAQSEEMARAHAGKRGHDKLEAEVDSIIKNVAPKLDGIAFRLADLEVQLALTTQLAKDIKTEQTRLRPNPGG